jgi:hypothetical protein
MQLGLQWVPGKEENKSYFAYSWLCFLLSKTTIFPHVCAKLCSWLQLHWVFGLIWRQLSLTVLCLPILSMDVILETVPLWCQGEGSPWPALCFNPDHLRTQISKLQPLKCHPLHQHFLIQNWRLLPLHLLPWWGSLVSIWSFGFFFGGIGVWTQGLMPQQVLYHLRHSAIPVLCWEIWRQCLKNYFPRI